ncbi:hypothetical protein BaRGS_00039370 [Batillaria attramentaria]|uniref:Ubiquitin-like domain-containing protein n=1 Tax=Batillaria attramentaria TaxID=370345 RepID=A0ABD0J3B9_9CAEN
MATRPDREPFVSVTLVVIQKYSMHHMKFDLSPITKIADLKKELQKILKIPWEQQKWMLHQITTGAGAGPARQTNNHRMHFGACVKVPHIGLIFPRSVLKETFDVTDKAGSVCQCEPRQICTVKLLKHRSRNYADTPNLASGTANCVYSGNKFQRT